MSKKPIPMVAAALVATLLFVVIVLTPPPNPKRHALHIAGVNRVFSVSITFTNHAMLNPLPAAKP